MQKEQNPFKLYGSKEVWEKIQEQGKNNQPVRFPGIGIEQTPVYQMQRIQGDKNLSKKQDFLSKLSKFDFLPKGHPKQLNVLGMYDEIDQMKRYQARMERIDPINQNCIILNKQVLQHKLSKAIENAAFLWGGKEQLRYDASMFSFDKSMNELLNKTNKPQLQVRSTSQLRTKHIFTKGHCKIKLSHEI